MSSLTDLYTQAQLKEMLKKAYEAKALIATKGGIQEIRVRERHTRFHTANIRELDQWIAELEAALGTTRRARSRPVYF